LAREATARVVPEAGGEGDEAERGVVELHGVNRRASRRVPGREGHRPREVGLRAVAAAGEEAAEAADADADGEAGRRVVAERALLLEARAHGEEVAHADGAEDAAVEDVAGLEQARPVPRVRPD